MSKYTFAKVNDLLFEAMATQIAREKEEKINETIYDALRKALENNFKNPIYKFDLPYHKTNFDRTKNFVNISIKFQYNETLKMFKKTNQTSISDYANFLAVTLKKEEIDSKLPIIIEKVNFSNQDHKIKITKITLNKNNIDWDNKMILGNCYFEID